MIDRQMVEEAVFKAIDSANKELSRRERLVKSAESALTGPASALDSLGFVIFVTIVENKIKEEFGAAITLADERALSGDTGAYETVGKLVDYICLLLNDSAKGN
jgi:acyl carrier protein